MRTVEVIVVPYDPKWKTDFEKIKAEINEIKPKYIREDK